MADGAVDAGGACARRGLAPDGHTRGRRARPHALLPRHPAQRPRGDHRRHLGRAPAGDPVRGLGAHRRLRSHAPPVRSRDRQHQGRQRGSVGMPYEGQPGAYWALLGPDVEFRRTEYDLAAAADAIRATSYPDPEEKIELLASPHSAEEAAEVLEQRALEGCRDPGARAGQALRRQARTRAGRLRTCARRLPRRHRPERLRQDDAAAPLRRPTDPDRGRARGRRGTRSGRLPRT